MKGLRAVLADDHRLTANALADTFRANGIDVAAVVHNATDALEAVRTHAPHVLITDLDMGPGPSGLDLAARVKAVRARIGVVVLTAYEDPKLLAPKMPSPPPGVMYVVKHQVTDTRQLLHAVTQSYRYATGEDTPPKRPGRFALTESQANLLRLVAQGLTNEAIADELKLTTGSVATSISRLAKRLGVRADESRNVRAALTQKYFDYVGFQRDR